MNQSLPALLGFLLAIAPAAQAQFNYTTNNGAITITGYTGSGGELTIPDTINGLPVTSIGDDAFSENKSLTNVTIPDSVTSIGDYAFYDCISLTVITVDTNNPVYSSVNGVLFDESQTTLIQYPPGKGGSYTIPYSVTSIRYEGFFGCSRLMNVTIGNSAISIGHAAFENCYSLTGVTISNSVTSIGDFAFAYCYGLTRITIGNSVTGIGENAFADCYSLTKVYFTGNAPAANRSVFSIYNDESGFYYYNATACYLPGTTGWDDFSANTGIRAIPWLPLIQTGDAGFGVRTNQFEFNINWASGQSVVVEACTNLHNPVWLPVATNTLTSDSSYFSDPQGTNYPARFYRLHSP